MRERKLYQKRRARKGEGRSKNRPVQVSAELHDELSMIKDAYSKCLGRPVTFEQMLRRWIDRLSRIDSDVNDEYQVIRKTRQESEAGAAGTAGEAVNRLFKRMQGNGTSLFEEALKEQAEAEAALEDDCRAAAASVDSPALAEDQVQSPEPVATPEVAQGKRSEKRFVHSDGRQYPALEGSLTPYYAKVPGRGNVGQRDMFKDGFELKDVEI